MPKGPSQPDDSSDDDGLTSPAVPTNDDVPSPSLQRGPFKTGGGEVTRVVPHSPEAERGVLSCMMQDPANIIGEATIKIGARQFYDPGRSILFATMVEMHDGGQPVDVITLSSLLKDRKQLDKVGGAAEIMSLNSYAPSAREFTWYAKILRNKFVLRQIIDTSQKTMEDCFEGQETVDGLLDSYEADVLAIREGLEQKDEIKPLRDHLMETLQQIESLITNKGKTVGIPTGFQDFDEKTNGMQAGQMIVVAARPSMGKTSFGLNIVENVAIRDQRPIGVFSLEMGADQLTQRLLASQAGIGMSKIMKGELSQNRDFAKIQTAAAKLAECRIYIDDTPSLSIMALRAKARRMKKQFGIELIMIDYLQLMRSESRKAQDSRQQEVAEISQGVKALAKELKLPVIVLAQLNRGPETRTGSNNRPRVSDLRESGSIEQDADIVTLLHRDIYYAENEEQRAEMEGRATLIVGKNRNGATGDVPLTFRAELMRFESRARDEFDE
ncbi:MAG: replicative DNA helicase [Verrucomicrobia bacterium]|nr:replicative DNA helicase [Verrucomicrobiota bacterium]